MELLIHLASLTLALAAAAESLYLIRLTGRSHAWLYFVIGFILIASERTLELFSGQALADAYPLHELASDALMLAVAAFSLYGIHGMRGVFLEHRTTQEKLQHELDDLKRFQRLTVGRELRMKELVQENRAQQEHINAQEHPGTPRNTQEHPGTPRNTQEHPGTGTPCIRHE